MRITHRSLLVFVLGPLLVATAIGAALLWPEDRKYEAKSLGPNVPLVDGTADEVTTGACSGDPSDNLCQTVVIAITSGPDRGQNATIVIQQGPGQPDIAVNDKLVLGRAADGTGPATYYFSDFQRKSPLLLFTLVFAASVVVFARWRGIGALVGLAFTWLVVTNFIIPAVLHGESPVWVALVGAAAIVFVVLYVAHGFRPQTTIALVGTILSLGVTGLLAWLATDLAHLTGLASEEAAYIQNYAGQVNLKGLLLGGIIIGSLGVLNDVTVTQSAAVFEIHDAQPEQSRRSLYRAGMRVGRDHIASTIYTLVLAYAGAALPLLILFSIANRQFVDVVASDVVAEEIMRALVGSVGLMLSVPLTTALAAMTAKTKPSPTTAVIDAPETAEPTEVEDDTDYELPETSEDAPRATEPEPKPVDETESTLDVTTNESEEVIDVDAFEQPPAEYGALTVKAHHSGDDPLGLQAPPPKKKFFSRKPANFERKISRREKKFWDT